MLITSILAKYCVSEIGHFVWGNFFLLAGRWVLHGYITEQPREYQFKVYIHGIHGFDDIASSEKASQRLLNIQK
jgi:hypothetical protein